MQKISITRFVSALGEALARGDGYIMGAYGQNPKTGSLDLAVTECKAAWKPTGYYYNQYTDPAQHAQALKWREHCVRVWDCNGLAEGIYQLETGININSKARYNYAQWCNPKGEGMIPASKRVAGAAVFWGSTAAKIEHVAYLFEPVDPAKPSGDWWIVEARGVMDGVIKTKLSKRKPKYWGWMSEYFDYEKTSDFPIYRGEVGDTVKKMQEGLIKLGYNLGKWGADGEFGAATEAAIKAFQKDYGMPETGVFSETDAKILEDALTKREDTYTILIRGVHQAEMEAMKARWPDCEVVKE